MSTRLALGAAAALAGLAALSRRGSRSGRPEDDGQVMVLFLETGDDRVRPQTREEVRRVHFPSMRTLDGFLVEHPADASNRTPIALLVRAKLIYHMHHEDDEPSPQGDLLFYAYGGGEDMPTDPAEWRGTAQSGSIGYFQRDFELMADHARDYGGPLTAFDVDIIDFVNLSHPEPEDFEVAARFPRLLTYRSRGLGGRKRWNFGPGLHPHTGEQTTVPMPAHLVPTIERIWDRAG